MPSVVHVVTTGNFAGVERYVGDVAAETAARGWDVTVVGGSAERMPGTLDSDVRWLPGAAPLEALRSLRRIGRQGVCHVHMTTAETVSIIARPFHRAPIVSTRHFAAPRGASRGGRLLAPRISPRLAREIAVSDFVARRLERPPDAVIRNGVPSSPRLWKATNRVVLVLQRLEREKDTLTALRAWNESRLVEEGWSLRIVGNGSERAALEAWAATERLACVEFGGWTARVPDEFARAGIVLAPAPAEPFGLAVVEAMAAGVPVVACAGGGHLETVGLLPEPAMFPPGDGAAAATALCSLRSDISRSEMSDAGRQLVSRELTIARHVDQLLNEYDAAHALGETSATGSRSIRMTSGGRTADYGRPSSIAVPAAGERGRLRELVVCSLEPWDEVWRRNQFFVDALMKRNPGLRVLFVEPPADVLFDLQCGRRPTLPRLRSISSDRRLRALRPLKPLPRKVGRVADQVILGQVLLAARAVGFSHPTLWLNDVTYAPLIARTGWPSLYDVTDDWLLAPFPPRELERLRRLDELALALADEVVVCSPALVASRGAHRAVTLVPNGVDLEHFRRPQPRPIDLPDGLTAVYVGSLHEARIDVELVVELANALPQLSLVLVGPSSLEATSEKLLAALPNVFLLGQRPYRDVPAYLQHADVVIVPHRVTTFTESLDPIKAYECLAIDRPTVATPVAGFRDHRDVFNVVPRDEFSSRVASVLKAPKPSRGGAPGPLGWDERAAAFEQVILQAGVLNSGRLAANGNTGRAVHVRVG